MLSELDKDIFRKSLNKYTIKAFQILPELDKPLILDMGCGSGVPTIELTKLCDCKIIGVDVEQSSLDKLNKKIENLGLSNRVETMKRSLFDLDFPDENFDVIWAESSINIIGFEKGLKEWKHFLKKDGLLVVHDDALNLTKKIEQIHNCGYDLINHFEISKNSWWKEYFEPLEKHLTKLRGEYKNNLEILQELDKEQREIDDFKKNPYSSVFFISRKRK